MTAEVSVGQVRLFGGEKGEDALPVPEQFVNLPGVTKSGDRVLQAATSPFPDPDASPPAVAVPSDSIEGALRLRPLRPGDRMHYRGFHRKVSGVLKTARVPVWDRGDLVALAGKEDVVAILGTTVALADGCEGEDCYYFRLAPPPTRPSP